MNTDHSESKEAGDKLILAQAHRQVQTNFVSFSYKSIPTRRIRIGDQSRACPDAARERDAKSMERTMDYQRRWP